MTGAPSPSPAQPATAPAVAYFGFTGVLESSSVTRICAALNHAVNNKASSVCLTFSSLGGHTADGIYLYNHIRSMPIPVTIHAMGNIASVAVAASVRSGGIAPSTSSS